MKKLLLASTALVLSAGVAAADVRVSGDGRMGVGYNSALTAGNKMFFTSRIRIAFTASGETDGGLAFGGSIRADNAPGGAAGTAGSVFISGDFGRITMGDTNGAAEQIVGDLNFGSLTGLGDHHEAAYLSNAGGMRPTARYDYSFDGFRVAISASNPGTPAPFVGDVEQVYSVAAGYTFEGISFGLGYESAKLNGANRVSHIIGSVGGSFEGITAKALFGRASQSGAANQTQAGLSLGGTFDEFTVNAYYMRNLSTSAAKATSYGIGGAYDLGGGARLTGGIVRTDNGGAGAFGGVAGTKRTLADFGVAFNF